MVIRPWTKNWMHLWVRYRAEELVSGSHIECKASSRIHSAVIALISQNTLNYSSLESARKSYENNSIIQATAVCRNTQAIESPSVGRSWLQGNFIVIHVSEEVKQTRELENRSNSLNEVMLSRLQLIFFSDESSATVGPFLQKVVDAKLTTHVIIILQVFLLR